MGSATSHALAASNAALAAVSGLVPATAEDLFAAARVLTDTPQLSGALADQGASEAARTAVVDTVFTGLDPAARSLLHEVAGQRWSSADDLIDAVEELAIGAAAAAEPTADVEGELFAFARIVASDPELELALGARLGDSSVKAALVRRLLEGRVSAACLTIAVGIVGRSRGRRIRTLLSRAQGIVAAQRGRIVATVTTATPISDAQAARLRTWLTSRYQTEVSVDTVVDPALVGGLRVQVADDVIDASVASRLTDLRQRLAG